MKATVIGSGMMGQAAVEDLSRFSEISEILVTDVDVDRARQIASRWSGGRCRVTASPLDLADRAASVELMRGQDLAIGAYPERLAVLATEYALEAGVHLVDMTALWDWEKRAQMDGDLKKAGITVIPGCGVAPGLSNILTGIGAEKIPEPRSAVIYCGGLPQNPGPPLDYSIVFSFETVMDEYTVPPRILRSGEMVTVDPLSGYEEVEMPGPVGRAEAFYTDGLTTLVDTMARRGLRDLGEKTVRYRGHRDRVLFLKECGFFGREPVGLAGQEVRPRDLTSALLTPLLQGEDDPDVTVMRVQVNGREESISFEMVDFYDREKGISSMARTTAYTCSTVALMLARGQITQRGFVPPEEAVTLANYQVFLEGLKARGIEIREARGLA